MIRLCNIFVLFTLFVIYVTAYPAVAGDRVALVIGNSSYGEDVGELKNPVNDAVAVRKLLKQLDFDVQLELDLDYQGMVEAIKEFGKETKNVEAALVFYAGHAAEIHGKNILFPTDLTIPNELTEEERDGLDAENRRKSERSLLRKKRIQAVVDGSVNLDSFVKAASLISDTAIIIIDACRDDAFSRLVDVKNVTSALKRTGTSQGALYAFAAAPGEPALDGDGENSPFTSALLKYLGTAGQDISIAMKLVQQEVYDRTHGMQLPYIVSGLPKMFIPNKSPENLDERQLLLLAIADLTAADKKLVERIARRNDGIPLAPLYASLLTRGAATMADKERDLQDAAASYIKFQIESRRLRGDDPEVRQLVNEAQELMRIGSEDEAWRKLTEALQLDRTSSKAMTERLTSRWLSEAGILRIRAQLSLFKFDRQSAIQDLEHEVKLYRMLIEVDEKMASSILKDFGSALLALAEQYRLIGNSSLSLVNYQLVDKLFDESNHHQTSTDFWILQEAEALLASSRIYADQGDAELAISVALHGLERLTTISDVRGLNTDFQNLTAEYQDTLSGFYLKMGNFDEATRFSLKSIDTLETILRADQTNDDATFSLSASYINLASIQLRQGYLDGVRESLREASNINYKLLSDNPDSLGLRFQLAGLHSWSAELNEQLGDLSGALKELLQNYKILFDLLDLDPNNVTYQEEFSNSLNLIGHINEMQGNTVEAMRYFERHLNYVEGLIAKDPENLVWKGYYAASNNRLASVHFSNGDSVLALNYFLKDLEISKELVAGDPNRVAWIEDLGTTYHWLAQVYDSLGNVDEMMKYLHMNVELRESLHARDKGNALWRHDLAVAYASLAGGYRAQGELQDALGFLEKDLAMSESLVKDFPNNPLWQEGLAATKVIVSEIYLERENYSAALLHALDGLRINKVLVSQDVTNSAWQSGLSRSNNLLGQIYLSEGDAEKALAYFQEDLLLAQILLERDPQNFISMDRLSGSYRWLAEVNHSIGESELALNMNLSGQSIIRQMLTHQPEDLERQRHLLTMQTQYSRIMRLLGGFSSSANVLLDAVMTAEKNFSLKDSSGYWSDDIEALCAEFRLLSEQASGQISADLFLRFDSISCHVNEERDENHD